MDQADSERARAAIAKAVEKQIADGDPPETAETLERLVGEGYTRDEAVRLIGQVVAEETFGILRQERGYDRQRYVAMLNRLPSLPGND